MTQLLNLLNFGFDDLTNQFDIMIVHDIFDVKARHFVGIFYDDIVTDRRGSSVQHL